MSWHCTAPTKTESPDSTGTTLEEIKGNVRITVLLSTCPLFLLQTTKPCPPSYTTKPAPVPPPNRGNHDWLEVMVGREMQDLEYAQWFYQCNLKVHGFCASLVYFYFLLAVGYYSSQFRKLYEEAEDSFFHLSGEL